jgi:hypothetical protein
MTGNVRLASINEVLSVLDSMIEIISSIMETNSIIDDFAGWGQEKMDAKLHAHFVLMQL